MQFFDYSNLKTVKKYNEIYDDRIKKYTLNIPIWMWDELKRRTAPGQDIRRVSIYLVAVLRQHLKNGQQIDMDILINAKEDSRRIASAEHRREDNKKYEKDWLKFKIKGAFRLFQPKQQIFDFRK